MNPFPKLMGGIKSSQRYDQFLKLAAPLKDHFGINHFWYYRVTHSGQYSYIGTNAKWDAFCFNDSNLDMWQERIRAITRPTGIQLMQLQQIDNGLIKDTIESAWGKFKIHLSLNCCKQTTLGIEGYGFGTGFNDPRADEMLLNQLPLLQHFAQNLRQKNRKVFEVLDENQTDLFSLFGPGFMGSAKAASFPRDKNQFLYQLGLGSILKLDSREVDILSFARFGYPAAYIAKKLRRSERTVENQMAVIKEKLDCKSKVELIHLAQQLGSIGYFS